MKLKPVIKIIDIVPKEDWIFWESYWIWQMKSWGFNLLNNMSYGSFLANPTSFKKGNHSKGVFAFNKKREIIYSFNSAEEASKSLNISRSQIPLCCGGKSKTVKGIVWLYKENVEKMNKEDLEKELQFKFNIIKKPNNTSFKSGHAALIEKETIVQDIKTLKCYKFKSRHEVAKFIGTDLNSVCRAKRRNALLYKRYKILE